MNSLHFFVKILSYLVLLNALCQQVFAESTLIKKEKIPGSHVRVFLYEERVETSYWENILSVDNGIVHIRSRHRAPQLIGKVVYLDHHRDRPLFLLVREIEVKALESGSNLGVILSLTGDILDEKGDFEDKSLTDDKRREFEVTLPLGSEDEFYVFSSRQDLVHFSCHQMLDNSPQESIAD